MLDGETGRDLYCFIIYAAVFLVEIINCDLCIYLFNNCPVSRSLGSGLVAQLCAKAQHHSKSVQSIKGHLARQGDESNNSERCVYMCASSLSLSVCK